MKYFQVETLYQGNKNRKLYKAHTRNDALSIAKSKSQGIVVAVNETPPPLEEQLRLYQAKIVAFVKKKRVKMPSLIASVRQLAVMTNAGISIHDSIKEVGNSLEEGELKNIYRQADDDLNAGSSLTESFSHYHHELGDVTLAMIELGESTGNMSESLQKLAEILEEIWENQQKFKKAIRYPLTVLSAICIAFTILMLFVVPKFKEIFQRLDSELPLPTKFLLGIEHLMSQHGLALLLALLGGGFAFKYFYDTNTALKAKADRHVLRVYLLGNIIFYATMSRFNLVLTELIKAGIPVADALDTALLTISNTHLKKQLSSVKISVQRGVSLTKAFQETGLYESMLVQMIRAGEQSGSLDKMLEKVTAYFKSKFSDIIDNITSYIEPILIGFIAAMVLLLALGIFMPMWDMAQAVKY